MVLKKEFFILNFNLMVSNGWMNNKFGIRHFMSDSVGREVDYKWVLGYSREVKL